MGTRNQRRSAGSREVLNLVRVKGTPRYCGREYGRYYSKLIRGFCAHEIVPDKKKLRYAKQCMRAIKKFCPVSDSFLKGMAEGAAISFETAVLISLHEELYHSRIFPSHCTAIAASSAETNGKVTLVGQNWDWQPQLYPWPSLVKLSMGKEPTVLAYAYPGLWNCCGINSRGLSLMWTGGGYFPRMKPKVGVPTYVLISEVLRKKTVAEAIAFLKIVPRAGPFIFLLGDAGGNVAVAEATPDKIVFETGREVFYRANLFRCPEIQRISKQERPDPKRHHSVIRETAIKRFLRRSKFRLSVKAVKEVLTDKNVFVDKAFRSVTIDEFIAVCEKKILLVKRGGGSCRGGEWVQYKV